MTEHVVSRSVYYVVFGTLLVLTAVTVGVAFVDLDRLAPLGLPLNTMVALTIAVGKALLVILYFMHVRYGTPLTMVFATSGFVWLGILFVLTMSDYLSRGWLPYPGK